MIHFVALIWSADDPAASAAAAQLEQKMRRASAPWRSLLSTQGCSVFTSPPTDPSLRSYVLPGHAGVVLGKLFAADLGMPNLDCIEHIDERATREILRTGGGRLVRDYWGGYVALLSDRETLSYRALAERSNQYTRWALRQGVSKADTV